MTEARLSPHSCLEAQSLNNLDHDEDDQENIYQEEETSEHRSESLQSNLGHNFKRLCLDKEVTKNPQGEHDYDDSLVGMRSSQADLGTMKSKLEKREEVPDGEILSIKPDHDREKTEEDQESTYSTQSEMRWDSMQTYYDDEVRSNKQQEYDYDGNRNGSPDTGSLLGSVVLWRELRKRSLQEDYEKRVSSLKAYHSIRISSLEKIHEEEIRSLEEVHLEEIRSIDKESEAGDLGQFRTRSYQERRNYIDDADKEVRIKMIKPGWMNETDQRVSGVRSGFQDLVLEENTHSLKKGSQKSKILNKEQMFMESFWERIEKSCIPAKKIKFNSISFVRKAPDARVIKESVNRHKRSIDILYRLDSVARNFVELGIQRSLLVEYFLLYCMVGNEKKRMALAEEEIKTIFDLDSALKKYILDTSKWPNQATYEDLKSAFSKSRIDITSIAEKCLYHAKEILNEDAMFKSWSEERRKDEIHYKKKELLCKAITCFGGDRVNQTCDEKRIFKEEDFMKMLKNLEPIFYVNFGETLGKACMRVNNY